MALDLVHELVAALRHPEGRAAIGEAVAAVVDELLQKRLAERDEELRPLCEVLGCSRKAATQRLARDHELRQLGVPSGRRLLFRPSEVTAFLRTRRGRGE